MNLPNEHVLQNGKYRLTHVVGQGGFGITYKGIWYTEVKGALGTVQTEVPICVKEYFFKDYCYRDSNSFTVRVHSETGRALFDRFKEKLIKEAKILSEVHHPHIVNVLEVFEENGTAYIAMEYISGSSLKYMMDTEGILSERKVLRYVRQIGEALQFVHEKSILHLDIKPSNILIDQYGKARLIDFGVSKRYDIEQQETSTTMLTLSKGFASIEQYDDEGTLNFSPCPDIYSLGATMYNLLTGKIPTESILRATRPLKSPVEFNFAITAGTEAVILKAMQIIPADRFQTVTELLAVLDLPSAEEEEAESTLSGAGNAETEQDDDTTVLPLSGQPDSHPGDCTDDEEERTIVNRPELLPTPKKKRKKGLLVSALITIFACTGSVVAFLVFGSKPVTGKTEVVNVVPDGSFTVPESVTVLQQSEESLAASADKPTASEKEITEKPTEKRVVDKKMPEKDNHSAKKVDIVVEPVQKQVLTDMEHKHTEPVRSPEEIDAAYSDLIASGKAKMATTDYSDAKADFVSAKKIKLTEEVVRLQISCDTKEEEKRIANKLAQYEEKMTFGKYKIVRKRASGKYGAIDTKGEERIPCIYLSVGKSESGRAFEREDNLFDIYNTDGVVVGKGLTYY